MAKQVPSPKFEKLRIAEIRLENVAGNPGEPYKKGGSHFRIEKSTFLKKSWPHEQIFSRDPDTRYGLPPNIF